MKPQSHVRLCGIRGEREAAALMRSVLADQTQSREVTAFPEQEVELALVHIGGDVGDTNRYALFLFFIYASHSLFVCYIRLFYGCCEGWEERTFRSCPRREQAQLREPTPSVLAGRRHPC